MLISIILFSVMAPMLKLLGGRVPTHQIRL